MILFSQHCAVVWHEVAEGAQRWSDQPHKIVEVATVFLWGTFVSVVIDILPADMENSDDDGDHQDDQVELAGMT